MLNGIYRLLISLRITWNIICTFEFVFPFIRCSKVYICPFSKCAKSSSFFARSTATSNGNRLVPEDFAFYLHIHNGFEGFIAHKIADFKSSFCFYTSWKFSKMTLRRTENWWRIRWNVHESANVCTNLRLPLCLMPIRSLNKTLLLSH